MKIFSRREKLSTGVTALATSDKFLYVGNVEDSFHILDRSYKTAEKLKINFGTIDVKSRNDSPLTRARDQFVREPHPRLRH